MNIFPASQAGAKHLMAGVTRRPSDEVVAAEVNPPGGWAQKTPAAALIDHGASEAGEVS